MFPEDKIKDSQILTWNDLIGEQKKLGYFRELLEFIEDQRKVGKNIFPANDQVFAAFKFTELAKLKVVILGQDPYFSVGQAHGLAFSVPSQVAIPPSLRNIFKELSSDLNLTPAKDGSLVGWAKQGVLLLNSVLTVEEGKPGSHAEKGWERFTDHVISQISSSKKSVVFLLWGAYAIKKSTLIDQTKHHILTAPHPSPLSASRGFLGCKHFSKTNQILVSDNQSPIDWATIKSNQDSPS